MSISIDPSGCLNFAFGLKQVQEGHLLYHSYTLTLKQKRPTILVPRVCLHSLALVTHTHAELEWQEDAGCLIEN
jgi:hypothetical protein